MPRITLDISQKELDALSKLSFNELTAAQLERLAILGEEMGETQQIIGKILRHGYDSRNPKQPASGTNRTLLQDELGHVFYAVEMLIDAHDVEQGAINAQTAHKRDRIKHYLHHQEVK